jgi:putative PIN family toxin of toxin-antitoxin system
MIRLAPLLLVLLAGPAAEPRHGADRPLLGPAGALAAFDGIAYDTMVRGPKVVLDTNVGVAAVRSNRGASFRVLSLVGTEKFQITVSVPLVLEYEDALLRNLHESDLTERDVRDLLDYLCSVAQVQEIFFLWRPFLRDPRDDMVLEVAVAAGCEAIVTHNRRDFRGIEQFGLEALTPQEFLKRIGGLR